MRAQEQGFTLIELLVSMALFVVLAAAMYGGTQWVMDEREIVNERAAELEELQRAVRRLHTDFGQAWPRAVRDELGRGQVAALLTERRSGLQIRLSKSGWRNPTNRNRSVIQRVQYRYDEDEDILYRDTWPVLDRVLGEEPLEQTLLRGVTEFEVEFLDDNGEWRQDWPVDNAPGFTVMPRAIRYRLDTDAFGRIERLIEVPG